MMRSVSFVDRVELDFSGNHFSHALALADVDGDGVSDLTPYKHNTTRFHVFSVLSHS